MNSPGIYMASLLIDLDFILMYGIKNRSESESHSVMSDFLWPHGLYSPWNSSGQNTGLGSLSLLRGIFPTEGSNSGLPHCRQILYQLSHQGSSQMDLVSFILNKYSVSLFKNLSFPKSFELLSLSCTKFTYIFGSASRLSFLSSWSICLFKYWYNIALIAETLCYALMPDSFSFSTFMSILPCLLFHINFSINLYNFSL